MKIKNNKKHTKKIAAIITSLSILVLAGIIVAAYLLLAPKDQSRESSTAEQAQEVNLESATEEQKAAGAEIKKNALEEKPNQSSGTIEVLITAANQNGNLLQIRTSINGVSNQGTCKLSLTGPTAAITREVEIQALASSSTCKGFDIPTSELSKGTWTINLDITRGSDSGKASQTVEIN